MTILRGHSRGQAILNGLAIEVNQKVHEYLLSRKSVACNMQTQGPEEKARSTGSGLAGYEEVTGPDRRLVRHFGRQATCSPSRFWGPRNSLSIPATAGYK